jgi:hypothetical protein
MQELSQSPVAAVPDVVDEPIENMVKLGVPLVAA